MVTLLLLACVASELEAPPASRDPALPADAEPEAIGAGEPEVCPSLFRQDVLPDLRLQMTDADWAAIQADYRSYVAAWHPARFAWVTGEGDRLEADAQVRLRGNPGFSWLGDKMQFLVSFDEVDPEARFVGQRALVLDASWYHPTLLRDRLAYAYLRRLGVPAPCANNARLTVNGSYYGLYTLIERLDQEFLDRVYGREGGTGTLWEGGSDIDENADATVPGAVAAYFADPSLPNQAAVSDLDGNLLEWAAEAVIPQNDGYWCCSHNFYVYEHPTAGISFLPWDLDYSFDTAPVTADPDTFYRDNDRQPHLEAVRADPDGHARWLAALRTATTAFDPAILTAEIDEWAAQTAEAFADDPHTSVSQAAHDDGVARLRAFVEGRHGHLGGWLACAEGDDTDHDGDGVSACSDCDDGDAAIHPGAVERCNRRDDDCDQWSDEDAGCDVCDEVAFDDGRFLICSQRMTWAEADTLCRAEGGELGAPSTTGEWYAVVFDTYWQDEAWAGVSTWWAGPGCTTLIPSYWTTSSAACDTELPAVCRL